MLAKIGAGRRFHAIRMLAQINLVEIDGKDLILGKVLFQLIGQNGLFHLAGVAALRGEQQLLDELLGNGAAALALASLAEVVDGRTHDGHGVYAHVAVKGVVFGSQKRHGQKARHVLEADDKAFFMVERAKHGPIACQNNRSLGLFVFGNAVEVGQVARGPVKKHNHSRAAHKAAHYNDTHEPEGAFFQGQTNFHGRAIPFFWPGVKGGEL